MRETYKVKGKTINMLWIAHKLSSLATSEIEVTEIIESVRSANPRRANQLLIFRIKSVS